MLNPEYRALNWALGRIRDKFADAKTRKADTDEDNFTKLTAKRRKKRRKRE